MFQDNVAKRHNSSKDVVWQETAYLELRKLQGEFGLESIDETIDYVLFHYSSFPRGFVQLIAQFDTRTIPEEYKE